MEETVVLTPVVESAPLLLNPLTWIVAFIILGLVYEFFWGKNLEKLSSKFQEPNKTSTPTKPVAKKTAPKKVAKKAPKKKTPTKRAISKKTVVKRTPKKGGK
tara:strand:- start:69 stop:374 length:306 start_codon:yes stop_codon:yes gene_type:complete